MTIAHTTADRPDDADARFAAYPPDVAAHVDHPDHGEEHRTILSDDPQTQRAWFDLVENLSMTLMWHPALLLSTAVTVLAATAILVDVAVRLLP
jgi:hypothetical protein